MCAYVTGVQTCALPISVEPDPNRRPEHEAGAVDARHLARDRALRIRPDGKRRSGGEARSRETEAERGERVAGGDAVKRGREPRAHAADRGDHQPAQHELARGQVEQDRKSTRLNSITNATIVGSLLREKKN